MCVHLRTYDCKLTYILIQVFTDQDKIQNVHTTLTLRLVHISIVAKEMQ